MRNYIKILRSKFKKYEIDGYVIPKNDDYFTEYSKLNRLEVISNFRGSAGLAIILKNKNYLFTDGRYTIQSKIESGKNFKIYGFEKLINCILFNLELILSPTIFLSKEKNGIEACFFCFLISSIRFFSTYLILLCFKK